jgi:hypothetical protein
MLDLRRSGDLKACGADAKPPGVYQGRKGPHRQSQCEGSWAASVYKGPPEAVDVAPSCRCAAALQAPEGGPQAAS